MVLAFDRAISPTGTPSIFGRARLGLAAPDRSVRTYGRAPRRFTRRTSSRPSGPWKMRSMQSQAFEAVASAARGAQAL